MSAIKKAAEMLRQEAEGLKACHTVRGDWCGDPAEADYHEMIALADAAVAERDELLEALQTIARKTWHRGTAMLHEEEMILVTQAIARATGELP